ncbi:MAG: hypothetical protein V4689_08465 [Verrucomicrobiota bacterium]
MNRVMLTLNLLCFAAFAFSLKANSDFRDLLHQSLGRIEQESIMAGRRDHSAEEVAKTERRLASVNRGLEIADKGRIFISVGIGIVILGMAFARKSDRRAMKTPEETGASGGDKLPV